jgi:hypothetical protein
MHDVRSEVPRDINEIQRLPLPMLAMVVGGFCSIGLGFIFLIIGIVWATAAWGAYAHFFGAGAAFGIALMCTLLTFLVDLILGIGLLYSYVTAKRGDWNKAMWMAIIIGIILIILGSYGGKIGGIIGLIGGVMIFIDPHLRGMGQAPPPPPPPPPAPPPG